MNPTLGSVGSLIIDDIVFQDGSKQSNVIGGAGIFAIYGMRIWFTANNAKSIGYVAHRGFDHPKSIDDALDSLDINLVSRTHSDKHTTRGLNTFGPNDHRDFEYIHPIIRTTPSDFPDSWIESMTLVHIISSTERTLEIINEWRTREAALDKQGQTQFLWEPLPWACLKENYHDIIEAGKYVDIFTPNHEEAASILGLGDGQINDTVTLVEECVRRLRHDLPHATIVIRASKHGAAVWDPSLSKATWVPAYWTTPDHVVDVVGAGNAFCGGFMVGWHRTQGKDPVKAAMYGSVASSFVVEQVGVPRLSLTAPDKQEQWNDGPSPIDRLEQLGHRTLPHI
ncbi:Ribokinase-like protein [Chlamydoabsidia padenii]|nr:Ribokinase-like protein [Chlamydoabsidia padenii]